MSTKLASLAKTTRPSLSGFVARERLFALLDSGRSSPITWVSGPPGSGKTTLAASYIDGREYPCLWYQLDEGDSDVATFFYYLKSAAAQLDDSGAQALSLFTPEYHAGAAAFTRRFFQTLFSLLRSPFAIVFDGYQDIAVQSALHEVMRDALSEVPANVRVFIISRGDPPPSLIRLRANRALTVIGWEALRLTRTESDAVARQRGRALPESALAQLYEMTQGWAAGLVLMLEQTRAEEVEAEPHDLSSPQLVFDYLAGEVLQKANARTREFLLKTAFLALMTPRMAEELSGQADAASILAALHANNYFVALKQTKPQLVYQYHPLLRDFLRARAREAFGRQGVASLQRDAAALLEQAGQVEDALALLCVIADWAQVIRLVNTHATALIASGRGETLVHWLETMPAEVLQRSPWGLYWLAASRLPFAPRESRQLNEKAFAQFNAENPPDVKGRLLACSGAIDAILFEWDDFALLDGWIAALHALVAELREFPSQGIEARVTSSLFIALMMRQPHHPDLERWVDRAYAVSQTQADPNLRISVEVVVATSALWAGHFPKALSLIQSIRELAQLPGVSPLALTTLCTVDSMYHMLAGAYDSCLKAVNSGLQIAQSSGVHIWTYQLLANGAAGALGAGDLETAGRFLKQMEAHPQRPGRMGLCMFHYFSTWDAMLREDRLAAYDHQKLALRTAIEVGCPFWEVLCRLATAQVQYECGEGKRAGRQLQQVHRLARGMAKNRLIEFMTLLGYAQLAIDHGRSRSGLKALGYALALGRKSGYRHFLGWRPKVMARLLAHALQAGIETDYVASLIKARSLTPDASDLASKEWPWAFQVFTLGPFRLLKDGRPLEFPNKAQRRPMELLKVLIAFGGQDVAEDRITSALWPRIDGDSAHQSFNTTLHRLRKLLGEDKALVLREGRLTLDRGYWWVDTWALEQATEALASMARGRHEADPADHVSRLTDDLLAIYRGPFMGEDMDQAWYFAARERLRNRFVRCMSEIGRFWERTGNGEQAMVCFERSVEADPLAEGLYRRLMLCCQELGRRAEGLEVYNRCRKTLAGALQVEPSAETRAVYEQLLHSRV